VVNDRFGGRILPRAEKSFAAHAPNLHRQSPVASAFSTICLGNCIGNCILREIAFCGWLLHFHSGVVDLYCGLYG
jgi:hypothetical protein